MALEGRFSEFSAAEALLLIAREEKSGRLDIQAEEPRLVLHFERGRVLQARDPDLSPDDSFLQLLREAQIVSAEQWKSLAAQTQDRQGRDPLETLLAMGVVTREQLKEWLHMHAQGVLDRILSMPDGSFRFESSPKAASFCAPLAEKTEFMVMEAGRRSDEASEILATELPIAGMPILLPGSRPVPTDPFRAALLRLVDGNRSVGDMLRTSAIPRYELVTLLKLLMERKVCALRMPNVTRGGRRDGDGFQQGLNRVAAVILAFVAIAGSIFVGYKLWAGF